MDNVIEKNTKEKQWHDQDSVTKGNCIHIDRKSQFHKYVHMAIQIIVALKVFTFNNRIKALGASKSRKRFWL